MTAVASSNSTERERAGAGPGVGSGQRPAPFARTATSIALAFACGLFGCSGTIDGDNAAGPGQPPGSPPGAPPGPGGMTPMGGGMTPVPPGPPGPGGPPNPMGGAGGPTESFPAQPGHIPMRRLTRTQYNNTIQDLLGIAGDPAGEFGLDEQEAGFNANNQAPLKDLQIEKYHQTAADLAEKAVANLGSLVKCAPGTADAACGEQFIRAFGKRAYRRPLADVEVARYKALFETGRTGADLSAGVSLVLTAMLQSPHFLYRVELGDPASGGKDGLALSAYEVGTRLSYFLTNSTPDDGLLAAADAGKLKTPEGIAAEGQRLLADPKSRSTLTSFYEQWLQIEDLLNVQKDEKAYPVFTPEVRTAMRDEVHEFVDQATRAGDGKLETLLTTTTTYLRGPLFAIYGLGPASNAGGSILKKFDLPATERAGIFTTAAVMSKHGHADQSSPVGRGFLIAASLLCAAPPDPPPGVDNNIPAANPNVTTRVRFEMHRTNPTCASCHDIMDPLGVAFEIYDGVGRFRAMDGSKPVDATSALKGTKASDGPVKNALDLMRKLAGAEEVRSCFARQMFRYAFGRLEGDLDKVTVADGLAALNRGGKVTDLMVALTTTPGFRNRIPVDLR